MKTMPNNMNVSKGDNRKHESDTHKSEVAQKRWFEVLIKTKAKSQPKVR